MPTRVSGNRNPSTTRPVETRPVAVKAATKEKLLKQLQKLSKEGAVEYGGGAPVGVRFVRVPLYKERHPDGFSFTALIPVGGLKPGSKLADPNKVKEFFIERTGGFAGITQIAGPLPTSGKGQVKDPFFTRFLDGQNRGDRTGAVTEKAPSDQEDGGAGRGGSPGDAVTLKAPSDAEDGGAGGGRGNRVGDMVTLKAPSDAEDGGGGGGRVGGGGGRATTMKYPSDNEDGGGGGNVGGGGRVTTMKAPSDNEDGGGGGNVGGGGRITTMKAPSDNEDGGGAGGGRMFTEKYPSDADE